MKVKTKKKEKKDCNSFTTSMGCKILAESTTRTITGNYIEMPVSALLYMCEYIFSSIKNDFKGNIDNVVVRIGEFDKKNNSQQLEIFEKE